MEEVKAHRERCCDDKDGIQERHGEDCLEAWIGRKVEITDRVLRARGKMMKKKAGDCLVTERLQELVWNPCKK